MRQERHTFLGLSADEWAATDGLPRAPWSGEPLTVDDVKAGIVAMLRRLDESSSTAGGVS